MDEQLENIKDRPFSLWKDNNVSNISNNGQIVKLGDS